MLKNKIKNKGRGFLLFMSAFMALIMILSSFTVGAAAVQTKRDYRNMEVLLGGVPFGVKFSTEGVVVIGFSDIDGISKTQNPAYIAGIRAKDIITKVNGRDIHGADELTEVVENSGGNEISLTYRHGGSEKTVCITPIYSNSEGRYKTGIWVKDNGAGIGTVTYILPESGDFGGLGHGICDGETGELIRMSRTEVLNVTIHDVKKGVSGTPGELKGHFCTGEIGELYSNTECGVFGRLKIYPENCTETVKVAARDEIREGDAYIVCTLDGSIKQKYKAEISSVNKRAEGSKCFVVKIVDPELIEKTGGIVQGMSGSPIIQNGKLVGAVTHVMINDPTVGYGIFIENMLTTMTQYMEQ